jgi:hypothetical protein
MVLLKTQVFILPNLVKLTGRIYKRVSTLAERIPENVKMLLT